MTIFKQTARRDIKAWAKLAILNIRYNNSPNGLTVNEMRIAAWHSINNPNWLPVNLSPVKQTN